MERSNPRSTKLITHVKAPRPAVYRALTDPEAIARWKVPTGMTSEVHAFEVKEGGYFRVSLTYESSTRTGKTRAQTDTYHGRFARLIEDEQVVEVIEFETEDPGLQGESVITITLADRDGGTEIIAAHEDLPPSLSPAENEIGWRSSLEKLRHLVESAESDGGRQPGSVV